MTRLVSNRPGHDAEDCPMDASPRPRPAPERRRGQIIPIFALSLLVFVGMTAIVVDISWYWANNLRIQRAADAAALAGVVHLPGDVPLAVSVARGEAAKNGYTDGVGGVTVTPYQDPTNPRRLKVEITAPVGTFFMRVFGISSIPAKRSAKAEFVLPVPMGSPENYYGVFGTLRTPNGGTTVTTPGNTGWRVPTNTASPSNWSNPSNAYVSDNVYATKNSTSNPYQAWQTFNFSFPSGATITGIEVEVEARSSDPSGCRLGVELSWNGGTNWTTTNRFVALTDSEQPPVVLGGSSDLWGRSSWATTELNNTNFRIRVQYIDPGTACTNGSTTYLDRVRVRVHYETSTFIPDQDVTSPYGDALNPRGFWGTMLNQGAEDVNGDAYLPYYETRTSQANPEYQPDSHYDYAVELPPGATNGEVWIFDPVFCATAGSGRYGTGDRWFSGTAATSAFYYLYDTQNTPYNLDDDTLVASSGNLFRRIQASDTTLGGPSGLPSCAQGDVTNPADGRYWHNRWWQLASGLSGGPTGRTYRVRTSSTDPNSPTDQLGSNGHNSFAIWARASGGSPRVYGIGAMQAFSPLQGGQASVFYLAQIDAVHAGKTMEINLWDPGDTGNLAANLQILMPTTTGYTPATFNYRAQRGTTNANATDCNATTGSGVTSVTTNTGGSSRFNGCWLTIEIPIPTTYTAPQPPGEQEPGWWKIRYNMSGSTSNSSFDVTTWEVQIRGNPVHLVLP
ncbi:MAG: hypothetical protein KatS3mg065_1040 [Chloroflexota bacterium]|nr:MAG: hypothetical protein KatS3mg065_1040 [Chloroflexota bacterium]